MIAALSEEENRDLLMSVGTHRAQRRLEPVAVARLLDRAAAAGESPASSAAALGLDGPDMVRRFLRLLDLPPSVQVAVAWRGSKTTLAFSSAFELARLPAGQQEQAAREALSSGLSSAEVKYAVQRMHRAGLDPGAAVAEIVASRPTIERRHVFIGMFSASASGLGRQIETLAQQQRDALLEDVLATLIEVRPAATRLTTNGFVISGDDRFAEAMRGLRDFEASIAATIEAQLGRR